VKRVAFVMEQTLGSITHYLNLRRESEAMRELAPVWLPIEFSSGPLSWAITGSFQARRAIGKSLGKVDGLFIHSITIALLCGDHFRRKPTILSTDGTPANKRDMRGLYGLRPQGRLSEQLKRAVYQTVMGSAAGFVAWSSWARDSLVADYGCAAEDVAIIPPGVDLRLFAPGARGGALPRILFVGGDFARKGGDILLEVFRRRLKGCAELELVTSTSVAEESGVHIHRGVSPNSEKLRNLYASCDLFALPTRADCYPLVCMEALASGLPVVATRVGGIPDLVRDGQTGHLVPGGDEAQLGDALEALVRDPARRQAMGQLGRQDAAQRFDVRENARRLFAFVQSRV
jgi:glycosyltransferase involved in cell wall biosynthesis